jgi:hypothetical protein
VFVRLHLPVAHDAGARGCSRLSMSQAVRRFQPLARVANAVLVAIRALRLEAVASAFCPSVAEASCATVFTRPSC